jgi:hypothetical protein
MVTTEQLLHLLRELRDGGHVRHEETCPASTDVPDYVTEQDFREFIAGCDCIRGRITKALTDAGWED